MGWRLLRRMEKRGRANENYEKVVDEVYELDSADDFNAFLLAFKKKGGITVERRGIFAYYFTVESVEIERRPPMATGKVQAVTTITLSLLKSSEGLIPPWELAPYSFRVSTRSIEETTTRFYPGVGDITYGRGLSTAVPLTNTAGSPLHGRSSRALALVEFSYNAPLSSFDSRLFWAAHGKINRLTTTICGMTFPPRTIRLESFGASYATETVETTDAAGANGSTTWRYYKIDVGLLANPRSYDQLFANVGTRLYRNGFLAQIWRWTVGGVARYGTYGEYRESGAKDGEPVGENVSLDFSGSAVSPIPTYRVGTPFEPVDFSSLGLPSEAPSQWRVEVE